MTQAFRTEELLRRLANDSSVAAHLGPGRVAVVVAAAQVGEPQLQLTAVFCVNLVARLFPVVRTLEVYIESDAPLRARVPRFAEATLGATIDRFLRELAPPCSCRVVAGLPRAAADVTVTLGTVGAPPPTVFVGSVGWIVQVSTDGPVRVGGPPNPVGAYTAAAFAAAEVWKRLLAPHQHLFPSVPIQPTAGTLTFSAYDYRQRGDGPNPDLPVSVRLARLTVVGLGAGGGATAYTLASLADVRGHITAIEPDEVTDTNLNRLVTAVAQDAALKRPKVRVVADLFRPYVNLSLQPVRGAFDDARGTLAPEDYQRVVAAVHSRAARRSIQLETPEVLWDAGATETGEFFVWRVALGRTQCLACRFPADEDPERVKARQLATVLGLAEPVWHRKVRDNEAFTASEINAILPRLSGLGTSVAAPSVGQRIGDWEAEHCGKMRLPDPDDEIPIPFAPVLAGVLVAGEVIKHDLFPQAMLDGYYWNALVGRFMPNNLARRPAPNPGCPVCQSPVFAKQYQRRWTTRQDYPAGG